MIDWHKFSEILGKYVKRSSIEKDDILFGSGLDISSIAFAEFILTLEEEFDLDINIDDLDASVKTAGQLHQRLSSMFQG